MSEKGSPLEDLSQIVIQKSILTDKSVPVSRKTSQMLRFGLFLVVFILKVVNEMPGILIRFYIKKGCLQSEEKERNRIQIHLQFKETRNYTG
jgi:hypothetical protein